MKIKQDPHIFFENNNKCSNVYAFAAKWAI